MNQDIGLASSLLDAVPNGCKAGNGADRLRLRDAAAHRLCGHEKGLWMVAYRPDGGVWRRRALMAA